MSKFDRYFFNQLLVSFLFFSIVLIAVFWVNKAVILFDKLISEGHSAAIFFEFSLLALPEAAALVFPISSFAAAVYVSNRLSNESEFVILRASGVSAGRLARPVLYFGVIIALVMIMITNVAIPLSKNQLNQREHEIGANLTAKLLREGRFLHPRAKTTLFIEKIALDGELKNVFLSDRREPLTTRTYTAQSAYLLQQNGGNKLVLVNGMTQILDNETNQLSTTSFSDLTFDVGDYFSQSTTSRRKIDGFSTLEMLSNPAFVLLESGSSMGAFIENLNQRFHQPLLSLLSALIGFGAIVAAGYSRLGTGRYVVVAIFVLVIVKLIEGALKDTVYKSAHNWPFVYAPGIFALLCVIFLILRADKTPLRSSAFGFGSISKSAGAPQ
ncbi:MAG: LPS export ABC transporter permease LptF [Paracoccaceae bacterium]